MSERQIPERKDFASNEQLQISEYDGHVFVVEAFRQYGPPTETRGVNAHEFAAAVSLLRQGGRQVTQDKTWFIPDASEAYQRVVLIAEPSDDRSELDRTLDDTFSEPMVEGFLRPA